jgi:membrane-bound lytic murein transglycosylase MltF
VLFKKYAAQFRISQWHWLKAIAINESSLGLTRSVAYRMKNPADVDRNKSQDGHSWGIMQTTLSTANAMRPGTTAEELNDPDISISTGAKYFAWLWQRYGGNLKQAVMAYNQGPKHTDRGKPYATDYWSKFQKNLDRIRIRDKKSKAIFRPVARPDPGVGR